jgi:FolB domain-containing protein
MDKIIIKNLRARGIIGINDWEREKKQDILINIEIEADLRQSGETDDLNFSVNYRTVSKQALPEAC